MMVPSWGAPVLVPGRLLIFIRPAPMKSLPNKSPLWPRRTGKSTRSTRTPPIINVALIHFTTALIAPIPRIRCTEVGSGSTSRTNPGKRRNQSLACASPTMHVAAPVSRMLQSMVMVFSPGPAMRPTPRSLFGVCLPFAVLTRIRCRGASK